MMQCPSYDGCGASLCPLDPGLTERIWYTDEEICRYGDHGDRRWIRKQRSIRRRQDPKLVDKPITFKMLYDASRPRKLSEEKREAQRKRLILARQKKAADAAAAAGSLIWCKGMTPSTITTIVVHNSYHETCSVIRPLEKITAIAISF